MTKNKIQLSKEPDIGAILRRYIRTNRIYQAALARQLGKTAQSIAKYQKRTSIQTKTLWDICHILKYNFFMDIAHQLPESYGVEKNIFEAKDLEIKNLKHRIEILEAEKAVLLESKK